MHVRGRPLEPIGVLSGGKEGYADSWKQTRLGPPSSRSGKRNFSCYIDRHVASVTCAKCGRAGQYRKQKLIERYGADIRLPDLREEIANCGRRGQMHDTCMARYVDLVPR